MRLSDTRYLISSLDPNKATYAQLLAHVRRVWQIENSLFFVKDRWWDEDRQWSVRAGLAERLASLRDAALTVLRLIPGLPESLPLRARADHLGRKLSKALKFIGAFK